MWKTYSLDNETVILSAIRSYFDGRGGIGYSRIDSRTVEELEDAIRNVGDCERAGFKNAFEVGYLGVVPTAERRDKITKLQGRITEIIGTNFASPEMDGSTRNGIEKARAKIGLDASNVLTKDFIQRLNL